MKADSSNLDKYYKRYKKFKYSKDQPESFGVLPITDEQFASEQEISQMSCSQLFQIIPEVSPRIFNLVSKIHERLVPDLELKIFIHNSPETQAYSITGKEKNVVFVVITSTLLNLLTLPEIGFVIGHEIGHAIMQHFRYPKLNEEEQKGIRQFNLLSLHRAMEITADRFGLLVVDSVEDAYKAMLKMASGMTGEFLRFDLSAYLDLGRNFYRLGGFENNLIATHPTVFTRLRALIYFEMSDLFYEYKHIKEKAPLTQKQMDKRIDKDLAAANGFRLMQLNRQVLQKTLLWGVLSIFVLDKRLTKEEQTLIKTHFPENNPEAAIQYVRDFGPKKVLQRFEEQLECVIGLPVEEKKLLCDDLQRFAGYSKAKDLETENLLKIVFEKIGVSG
jgi:predicted Zn-dependent protease